MDDLHKNFMGVIDSLIKKKIKEEPIQAVILGGSVARGDETEHSDIDIVFYVNRRNVPKSTRSFYKFRGKYIEEHYSAIEDLKSQDILPESKILYDKSGKIKKKQFNEEDARSEFKREFKKIKDAQEIANKFLKNGNYKGAFYQLYSMESPSFQIMHSLPPRYNLPFPSFRLLKSIKIIDKRENTEMSKIIKQIYTFRNKDKKMILDYFKDAYLLMNKIKGGEIAGTKNLGFYDKVKIRYNLEGLKKTFDDYPFIYSYRFIVGCLTIWAFDTKVDIKHRKKLKDYLLKTLGIKEINKELVEQRLNYSKMLVAECKKLL